MRPITTFCLIHGAWHDPACWEPLADELERRGHSCITPRLPLEEQDATFEEYARVVVDELQNEEIGPVVVGHSMSSAVAPLVAVRRPVPLLVYLCPAMLGFPSPADAPRSGREGYRRPEVDEQKRSWWPHDRAVSEMYGRLEPGIADRLARRLRPQPAAPFRAPYPLERPPGVPSAFLYAKDDEIFDDGWSRWMAREFVGVEPIELPGGHFPMLEHTELLAETLIRVSEAD